MNAKFLVPMVIFGLPFGVLADSDINDSYNSMKRAENLQMRQYQDLNSIRKGTEAGALRQGPSGDEILRKVDRGEALKPISGAERSQQVKALKTNSVLELQQSREMSEKLVNDTRKISDFAEGMPGQAYTQADSITGQMQLNGQHMRGLRAQEARLKAMRASASTPEQAAALDAAIAQVQADQVALSDATQRMTANNAGLFTKSFNRQLDGLMKENPNLNLMPTDHIQSMQRDASALESQIEKNRRQLSEIPLMERDSLPVLRQRLELDQMQQRLDTLKGEINVQRGVMQRLAR
jgi:hypothetical protein